MRFSVHNFLAREASAYPQKKGRLRARRRARYQMSSRDAILVIMGKTADKKNCFVGTRTRGRGFRSLSWPVICKVFCRIKWSIISGGSIWGGSPGIPGNDEMTSFPCFSWFPGNSWFPRVSLGFGWLGAIWLGFLGNGWLGAIWGAPQMAGWEP